MARGLITAARDLLKPLLFNGWGRKQLSSDSPQSGTGWVSMSTAGSDSTIITPSNYETQIAANRGPVHASLNLIAKQVGAATLRIYRPVRSGQKSVLYFTKTRHIPESKQRQMIEKAGPGSPLSLADEVEEIVAGHRLIDLFQGVSEIWDIYQLQYITAAYLQLIGNCYWWMLRDALGIPTSINIVPGEYMKVKQANGRIAGYQYKHGNLRKDFKADEVVHFKQPAPGAQFQLYGRGDLMGAMDDFNLLQNMYTFERALFESGGIPATMVSIQGNWNKDQRDAFREQYKQEYSGSKNAGKVFVGENVKIERLGLEPREMAYQSARKFTNTNIYSNMGAPEAMFTGQVSTRAALESSLAQVLIFAVDPLLKLMQQAMNAQLIPMYPDPVYVEYDDVVPEDKEFVLREDTELVKAAVVSGNEIRQKRGLEPMEGLEKPFISINEIPVGGEIPARASITQEQITEMFAKAYAEARRRTEGISDDFVSSG